MFRNPNAPAPPPVQTVARGTGGGLAAFKNFEQLEKPLPQFGAPAPVIV